MKKTILLSAVFALVYLSSAPTLTPCQEHTQRLERVLVGEIDASGTRVRFTGGTLLKDAPSKAFQSFDVVNRKLQYLGVSKKAIEDLQLRLQQSITYLEKSADSGTRSDWPSSSQAPALFKEKLLSIVEVGKTPKSIAHRRIYPFQVLTGLAEDTVKVMEAEICERLNERCFICPDGKIRCVAQPVYNKPGDPGRKNEDD